MPTYLSLFSGVGGLDLAVESHGYTCVGQVEWDDHATRVLERWWPSVPRWSDITGFTATAYAESERMEEPRTRGSGEARLPREAQPQITERPDLIVGGFPCQPASTAGRRKGTADDRWLWPEFARVIGELGPRTVLVENVPGLLTVNGGRAFSEVIGTLADLRYDATWTSLRAADVGACHRRERIFILAHTQGRGIRCGQPSRPTGLGEPDDSASPHPDDGRHEPVLRSSGVSGLHAKDPGAEPRGAGGRVAADADAIGREGRAGTEPEEPAYAAADLDGARPPADAQDADARLREASGTQGEGIGRRGPGSEPAFPWGAYGPAIERWKRVMGRAPHPVDDKGRLAPAFVEWMMGFPAGWTDRSTRTQALKQLGNAVVPQQGAAALTVLQQMKEEA